MNKAFGFALILVLLLAAMSLPARGNRERDVVVRVTGTVRLVGTGTMPQLVISGPDMEWYIDKNDEHKLGNLQHQTVTVEGTETVMPLTFANGRPAGERRTLRNIRIINIIEQ